MGSTEPADGHPAGQWTGRGDRTGRARWVGQWVWAGETALGGPTAAQPYGALDQSRFDRRVLFRKTFDLATLPDAAALRISADARYLLYLNGQEIGTGPVRHGPRQLSYDAYDVLPALQQGRNVIAVQARFYGHPVPWWEPSPPSFTMGGGGLVAELALDDEVIGSDESWRCQPGDAWQPGEPMGVLVTQLPEVLDARLLDPAWTEAEFDDSQWLQATVLAEHSIVGVSGATRPPTEPWGVLSARPIPHLDGETRTATILSSHPCTQSAEDDPRTNLRTALDSTPIDHGRNRLVVADFGMVVSGRIDLEVVAPAGSVIDGALLEVPTVAALDSSPVFRYTIRGSNDRYNSTDSVGGRYLVLVVAEGTEITEIQLKEQLRPRVPVPPFSSSDERLDEIYRIGLRTVDLTAHDAYVDCPTREQRAWTGDAVVHQSVDLIANQDWSLARWNPRLLAQPRVDGLLPMVVAGDFATPNIPTIPDWSLHWIRSVHNLYTHTGDRALVASLLGTAEGILRWFEPYVDEREVISNVPGWVLIDWSPVQVRGASAALNALVARGLLDFAEMSDWLGDTGRAEWARTFHDRLRTGFEAFWDADRRAYRDNLVAGRIGSSVSEHVAAAAICGDLVPAERKDDVRRLLLNRDAMFTDSPLADHGGDARGPVDGQPVSARPDPEWDTKRLVVGAQPFFRYVVHDALALLDAADEIAPLCLDWIALLKDAPTAFRECWEGGSYCHGWSATPTRDLVRYTLGISPAEPGFTTVRVAPRLGHLTHAKGAAPTPYGVISVAVTGQRVEVDSPVPVELVSRSGRTTRHPAGRFDAEI
ncbi:alpha-L-rhamnosidase-related protein [Kribbella solani]|uniref:alpha-L-rhamnosidase-related protein n=1 Tax=Kribbella solani TaxID=236067 RepID=UPI0029AF3CE7|nr:alpha-L-rhamnosidase N-terminal domain-containing protein [Kribbella solani]MDX2973298.1 alpha-L-rhamnosidase N-terminal domain-containing protein [Kribbella solani]